MKINTISHNPLLSSVISLLFPALAHAQDFELGASNFQTIIYYVIDLLYMLNPILIAVAFIVFFWGLSKFILNSGNTAEVQKGRKYMFWGILALFILVSVRAIISLLSIEFGFGDAKGFPILPTDRPSTSSTWSPE